jgi:hypothetical protein
MSLCPTCKAQEETYDHLVQCGHPSHAGWKSALRTDLLKYTQETHCHVIMQDILITGIHHWIHHRFPHHWHELITSQSNISWKQHILGRFSTKWTAFHHQHLQQNHFPLSDFNHGPIWLSKIVTIIWTHCHQLWESRNKDKHGRDSDMEKKDSFRAGTEIDGCAVLKTKMLPIRPNKMVLPNMIRRSHSLCLQQQQGWLATYDPMISMTETE